MPFLFSMPQEVHPRFKPVTKPVAGSKPVPAFVLHAFHRQRAVRVNRDHVWAIVIGRAPLGCCNVDTTAT